MTRVIYKVIRHEDGWAYSVNGSFSEAFPTHDQALAAARMAASEQREPGHSEPIEYEDEQGHWHLELSSGRDRPETSVEDGS